MNTNQQPDREKELFEQAVEITPPAERHAFLNIACVGEPALRERLDNLLRAHDEAASKFLGDQPAATIRLTIPDEEKLGTMIGRYKLLEKVGEGGFGSVYVAEQREPVKRRVALKVIKLGMDTKEVVARFEAERQALAMMDHPNIAKVLDAGATESGRPYFVMELVRGIRITDYCDQCQLATLDRLKLFIQVCNAVQHAHQKGIIHRDLKPSNILVTLHDGVPVPKVIDFGIAKATQQELTDKTVYTQLQQFIGTPAYISPEQAEMSGLDIDTRADIYSLGVLLYELLTGQTPFDARELLKAGLDELRRTIREVEPMRPSTKLNTLQHADLTSTAKRHGTDAPKLTNLLRGDIDWIVMKCLEKDRTRRYDTANGLAADIKRHLNHEPVTACPPSSLYRLKKMVWRNKLAFSAGAVVALSLVTGVALAVLSWRDTKFERDKALQAQHETEAARTGEQQQRIAAQAAQKTAETEQQRADVQARKATESQQQSRRLLYAADMNLAQQKLKMNNLGQARRLLDRNRPQPGEEDLRGWEWRYLWQLTRSSALVTLTNRTVRGFDVSFSPDGSRLAVGWLDGRVDLWDVPSRQRIRALTDRVQPRKGKVAFSPVRNLLAATSETNSVALYDLDSGKESVLWRPPGRGTLAIQDLSFSSDGSNVVIYTGNSDVWTVNVDSLQRTNRFAGASTGPAYFGAARLSPDNQRIYLDRDQTDELDDRYSIQCLDVATGKEIWQSEPQRDMGLTALAVSPDGRWLASGSGYQDPTIRVWDAANGRLLFRLEGHSSWVGKLVFSKDGLRLFSAGADQSIRVWNTSDWTEAQVLRGHVDEVHAVAISESTRLIASAGKDGNLMLWADARQSTENGYFRLPGNRGKNNILPLSNSRVVLQPPSRPPEVVDLRSNSLPLPVAGFRADGVVLSWFGTNLVCQWDKTNHLLLVREWRGAEFISRGKIALTSSNPPVGVIYNPVRQLVAWTETSVPYSLYWASLAEPERRGEFTSNIPRLIPFRFSEDGACLAAGQSSASPPWSLLRVWKVDTAEKMVTARENVRNAAFAAGGRVLVTTVLRSNLHEVVFYDLTHSNLVIQRLPGRHSSRMLAVSPDGGLVASANEGGEVRLFDPIKGELVGSLHGLLNAALGVAFSPDGRRLISQTGGREAVKLWDVGTRQELLTLSGVGSTLYEARWSPDGEMILAGTPWQAWRAPSWEEIAAAEAKDKAELRQP